MRVEKVKMVYVIVDQEGNYKSLRQTEKGSYYLTYDGMTSGFTFYTNKEICERKLLEINRLGNQFTMEYINMKSIPSGKRVDNISFKQKFLSYA